jgi:DNA-binding CsgD family transcriptional regulator
MTASAESIPEIHAFLALLCDKYGFDYFLFAIQLRDSFVMPYKFIISGYPEEWRQHYVTNAYEKIDPTVLHCATSVVPYFWEDAWKDEQSQKARTLMAAGRDYGLSSGVSIPVHTPRGESAMLSLASCKDHSESGTLISKAMPMLHAISFHLLEAVLRTVKTVELPPVPKLSQRETECLLWTAEGKTSWETSQILGISERTVVFHLQNVVDKLQVSNRLHAVVRAVSRGLIMPGRVLTRIDESH